MVFKVTETMKHTGDGKRETTEKAGRRETVEATYITSNHISTDENKPYGHNYIQGDWAM